MPDELVKTVVHVAEAPAAAIESPAVAVAPTTATETAIAAGAPPSKSQLFIDHPLLRLDEGPYGTTSAFGLQVAAVGRPETRVEQPEKDTFGRARTQLPRRGTRSSSSIGAAHAKDQPSRHRLLGRAAARRGR